MIFFKNTSLFLLCGLASCLLFLSSCGKDDDNNTDEPTIWKFSPNENNQTEVQEALILMEDGDIIEFSAGTFEFNNTLSIDSKNEITLRGAGKNETILSFAGQEFGAEGFQVSNCDWFLIKDMTVADAIGDIIKVKDGDGVSFVNIAAVYNGPVDGDNGAYALYPVSCHNVYIDNCYIRGASDAGIYVGQSENIVVRNNLVEENVAGIEIENSITADVYNNEARHNTGGILVFDLENLPIIPNGRHCRVFNNNIHDNDHRNFALSGTVQQIPPGTGIMLLSSADVEVFDNQIINNNMMGIGILSMVTLDFIDFNFSPEYGIYDPYVQNIHIHSNTFERGTNYPEDPNEVSEILMGEFPDGDIPHIMYDGVYNADDPNLDSTEGICIHDNTGDNFVDINVLGFFDNKRFDVTPHDCAPASLAAAVISAPEYE